MVKICQTCGDKGIYNTLIYCTECWDTVEHIYCMDLPPDDTLDEYFSYVCDSCSSKNEQLAKVVVFGDKLCKMTKSVGDGPTTMSEQDLPASATQVVGPIWRGDFDILGSYNGHLNGLEAYMPRTSYSKIVKVVRSMQPSISFRMKERQELWPKNFNELGAASYSVGFYVFPQFSRREEDYDNLVEYMISSDLAMTSDIGNLELTVFTSLEQLLNNRQRIQGKYYLWGMLRRKEFRENHASLSNKPTSEKNRISRGLRAEGCTKNPSFKLPALSKNIGSGSKQGTKRKKTKTVSSLLKCNHIPLLRGDCKRARSKRHRISHYWCKGVDCGKVTSGDLPAIAGTQGKDSNGQVTTTRTAFMSQQKLDRSRTSSSIHVEPSIPGECMPQVTVEIEEPKTITDEVNHTEYDDELAILIDNIVDTCHCDVSKRARKVNDTSNDQEAASNSLMVLASSSRESSHHGSMSVYDNLHFSTIGSPIPNTASNVGETDSDKSVTQVVPSEVGSDLAPTLRNMVDAHEEFAGNTIIEETVEAEQPNWETGMILDASCPNQHAGITRQEEDSDMYFSSMVDACEGHVGQISGLNNALVGKKEAVLGKDQPEPFSVLLPVQMPNPQTEMRNGYEATDPVNNTSSTPLLDYEEESDLPEVNPAADEEIDTSSIEGQHSAELLDPSSRMTQTSPQMETCSTPLIDYEEESEVPEPNPTTDKEVNPCSKEVDPCSSKGHVAVHFDSVVHDQGTNIEDEVLGANEVSTRDGLNQLDSTHSKNCTCTTPLLDLEDESWECKAPSTMTIPLSELSKETTIHGITDTEDTSVMTASILKIGDDDHETGSDGVTRQIGRYKIKADLAPYLEKILNKYGDIAQDCSVAPEFLLGNICKAVQDLESVGIKGLRRHHLDNLRNTLELGEALGVDVKWLANRCEELEKIVAHIGEYPALKNKLNELNKNVESRKQMLNLRRANLSKLQEKVKSLSGEFELLKKRSEKLDCVKEHTKLVATRFLDRSLADGLW